MLEALSTAEFYILLALALCPLHGYAIRQQIEVDSSGSLTLPLSTLYPMLKRIDHMGFIADEAPSEGERGPSKVAYVLTPVGRQVLVWELNRRVLATKLGKQRLGDRLQ